VSKIGRSFRKQRGGQVIQPRTINQYGPPLEGISRLGVGPGMSQQQMAGLIPLLRLVGVSAGIGKAGPEGIDAADWSDEDHVVIGKGMARIYVETSGGIGKPRGKLEPVNNWFEGTIAGDYFPLLLIKMPGIVDGVWTLVTFGCP
jgi:hypothetical protein